jgi:hypothetical protein
MLSALIFVATIGFIAFVFFRVSIDFCVLVTTGRYSETRQAENVLLVAGAMLARLTI